LAELIDERGVSYLEVMEKESSKEKEFMLSLFPLDHYFENSADGHGIGHREDEHDIRQRRIN